LTELRPLRPDVAEVPVDIAREPLRRVHRAFQAFFRRVQAGQKPGYPRFRSFDRYNSMSFSAQVDGEAVQVPKLGRVRFRAHREWKGRVKSCTLVRSARGRWSVSLVCELAAAPAKRAVSSAIGVDMGLEAFAVRSDGRVIENPRWLRASQQELTEKQRALARKAKGSRNRRKARQAVARCYERIRNRRLNFCHQLSKDWVSKFDLIAFEKLNIPGMARSRLARSILDAAWGLLLFQLAYEAEEAGRYAIAVSPKDTSQRCSRCGVTVRKALSERIHQCPACGLILTRDHNAALNILALGRSAVGLAPPEVQN
jgi:putative transposase